MGTQEGGMLYTPYTWAVWNVEDIKLVPAAQKDTWGKIRNKSSRRKEPMLLCFMAVAWFLLTDAPNSQECLGPCKHFASPASCVRNMPTDPLRIPQALNFITDLQGSVTIGFHGIVSGPGSITARWLRAAARRPGGAASILCPASSAYWLLSTTSQRERLGWLTVTCCRRNCSSHGW